MLSEAKVLLLLAKTVMVVDTVPKNVSKLTVTINNIVLQSVVSKNLKVRNVYKIAFVSLIVRNCR